MVDKKNNTGNSNTGYWNTGYWNTGDLNTGNRNTGNRNTGDCNTGDWNTGDCNTGDWNTGFWNTGDRNTGFFNTDESTVRMFNKDTGLKREDIDFPDWLLFNLTEWVKSEDMTDEEKKEHSEHETTGGYLKAYDYKKAFKNAFDKASEEELKKTIELPNFDFKIFEGISGISKTDFDNKLNSSNISKEIAELKERIKQLEQKQGGRKKE